MSKTGLHVQQWLPGTLDSVLRVNAPILKVMTPDVGPVRTVLEQRHDTIIVCRRYFDDSEQRQMLDAGRDGGAHCAELVAATFMGIIAVAAEFEAKVYLEGLNEIGLWDDADKYNDFTIGFATKVGGYRACPAVYSFATGNPSGYDTPNGLDLASYWAHYVPGLQAAYAVGGALALHEYSSPSMQDQQGWLCLRYRKALDALPGRLKKMDVLITECGIDFGTSGETDPRKAGWRGRVPADQYANQLRWYDHEISKDANVLGAVVFGAGSLPPWDASFDVTGVDTILDALREAPMPHRETVITIDPIAPAKPGGFIRVVGSVTGIDGPEALLTFTTNYPQRDASTNWGQAGLTKLEMKGDGSFDIAVPVGVANYPFDAPLEGTLSIFDLELDPTSFNSGGGWGEAFTKDVKFTVLPESQQSQPEAHTAPQRPVTPPIPPLGILPAEYDDIWKLAGDLAGYDNETDDKLAVYFQQVIKWRKGEPDGINPFVNAR